MTSGVARVFFVFSWRTGELNAASAVRTKSGLVGARDRVPREDREKGDRVAVVRPDELGHIRRARGRGNRDEGHGERGEDNAQFGYVARPKIRFDPRPPRDSFLAFIVVALACRHVPQEGGWRKSGLTFFECRSIVTHANTDFDVFAAMLAARRALSRCPYMARSVDLLRRGPMSGVGAEADMPRSLNRRG